MLCLRVCSAGESGAANGHEGRSRAMNELKVGLDVDLLPIAKAVASLRYLILDPLDNRRRRRRREDAVRSMNEQSRGIQGNEFAGEYYQQIPAVNEIRIDRRHTRPLCPLLVERPGPIRDYDVLVWSLEDLPNAFFALIAERSKLTRAATQEFARVPEAKPVVDFVTYRLEVRTTDFDLFVGKRAPLFDRSPVGVQAAVLDVEDQLMEEELAAAKADGALLDGTARGSIGEQFRYRESRRQRYLMLPLVAVARFDQSWRRELPNGPN